MQRPQQGGLCTNRRRMQARLVARCRCPHHCTPAVVSARQPRPVYRASRATEQAAASEPPLSIRLDRHRQPSDPQTPLTSRSRTHRRQSRSAAPSPTCAEAPRLRRRTFTFRKCGRRRGRAMMCAAQNTTTKHCILKYEYTSTYCTRTCKMYEYILYELYKIIQCINIIEL